MAAADAGPHLGVLGPMLGLILLRARADAGPQFGVLGHMLGLRSVGWGLCRASFCLCLGFAGPQFLGCAGTYAGHHYYVLGPTLGINIVGWGLCWAPCLWTRAYAGPHVCGLGPMLGLICL
jgi:hypothetical protein